MKLMPEIVNMHLVIYLMKIMRLMMTPDYDESDEPSDDESNDDESNNDVTHRTKRRRISSDEE
jgi:hypothetical protein